jgi:integration host factor subunit beta
MNKSELIEALAQKSNIPSQDAYEIINTIVDTMTKTLVKGDNIEIRGFGSFKVKQYTSYIGRDPKTGEPIQVRPKKLPLFKAGKELAIRVNK